MPVQLNTPSVDASFDCVNINSRSTSSGSPKEVASSLAKRVIAHLYQPKLPQQTDTTLISQRDQITELSPDITDNQLKALVGAGALSHATKLDISGCHLLTNSALRQLAKLPSLQSLNLHNCSLISNDGLRHLENLPTLRQLEIGGLCAITADAGEDLGQIDALDYLFINRIQGLGEEGLSRLTSEMVATNRDHIAWGARQEYPIIKAIGPNGSSLLQAIDERSDSVIHTSATQQLRVSQDEVKLAGGITPRQLTALVKSGFLEDAVVIDLRNCIYLDESIAEPLLELENLDALKLNGLDALSIMNKVTGLCTERVNEGLRAEPITIYWEQSSRY